MSDFFSFACNLARADAFRVTGNPQFLEPKMDNIPCRVSADLRQHEAKLDKAAVREFDPWNDALMSDLFGRLAIPLQDLLLKLEQIDKTNASFGVDKERSFDFLLPSLQKLREACVEEFRQL